MNPNPNPLAWLTFTFNRHFFIGFFAAFIFLIAVNISSYFMTHNLADPKAGTPDAYEVGFPKIFWVIGLPFAQEPKSEPLVLLYPGFYGRALLTDIAVLFGASFIVGDLVQKRKARKESQQQSRE